MLPNNGYLGSNKGQMAGLGRFEGRSARVEFWILHLQGVCCAFGDHAVGLTSRSSVQ